MIDTRARPFIFLSLFLAASWTLSGCAGMGSAYESPSVPVQSFTVEQARFDTQLM